MPGQREKTAMDTTIRRRRRLEMMTTPRMLPVAALSLVLFLTLPGLAAAQYTFTNIDVPGGDATFADGLSTDEIVGEFVDPDGNTHGFMLNRGAFTPFDAPGADGYTSVNGVNARGDHCGLYFVDGQFRAYFRSKAGVFTPLQHPEEFSSLALFLNAQGQVVGYYVDETRTRRGFIWSDGEFTPIDIPQCSPTSGTPCAGPGGTAAVGINDRGQVVGFYGDADHHRKGFLLSDGVFTTIDAASDPDGLTNAQGINNAGVIVGFYANADGTSHGFVLNDGMYTTIDVPGSLWTEVYAINAKGEIAGAYEDAKGIHGFIGSPSRGPGKPAPRL
jgi:probable HAF family extracellular repeat protein